MKYYDKHAYIPSVVIILTLLRPEVPGLMIVTAVLALRCKKAIDRVNACIDSIITKIVKFITLDGAEIMISG